MLAHGRTREAHLKVLSLYSGCGGLDLGFVRAGFSIVQGIELDPIACATHQALIGGAIEACSIDDPGLTMPSPGDVDVVIGGPPCQGFSVAGKMDPYDPRSRHVWRFLEVVESVRP